MLRIPTNHGLNFSEYVCDSCSNEFYVSYDPREQFLCPFCAGTAWINGHVRIYAKAEINTLKDEQEIRQEASGEQEGRGDS